MTVQAVTYIDNNRMGDLFEEIIEFTSSGTVPFDIQTRCGWIESAEFINLGTSDQSITLLLNSDGTDENIAANAGTLSILALGAGILCRVRVVGKAG